MEANSPQISVESIFHQRVLDTPGIGQREPAETTVRRCESLLYGANRELKKDDQTTRPLDFSETLECLRTIAVSLGVQWTSRDLEQILRDGLHNKLVDQLFRYGVIYNLERSPQYKVAGGLRELLLDLK